MKALISTILIFSIISGGLIGVASFDSFTGDDDLTPTAVNFGGSSNDQFESVISIQDGLVAVGYSTSFTSGDWAGHTGRGGQDAIIVKFDLDGNIVWKNNFGGSDTDIFKDVISTPDGLVAVGHSGSLTSGDWAGHTGRGGQDAIIVKFDLDGNIVWKNNFGGPGEDSAHAIQSTLDGFIVIGSSAAYSFGAGDFVDLTARGLTDSTITKFDSDFEIIWIKNFGGNGNDLFYGVISTFDGFIAVGQCQSNSVGNGDLIDLTSKGSYSGLVVKFDLNGGITWIKLCGAGGTNSFFTGVIPTSDGFVVSGRASIANATGDYTGLVPNGGFEGIIVKYDFEGEIIWIRNFGGSDTDTFDSIIQTLDGFIVVGKSGESSFGNGDLTDLTSNGLQDAMVVKYDPDGEIIWAKNFGGLGNDFFLSAISISNGFVAVGYSLTASFGNGDFVDLTARGGNDATMAIWLESTPISLEFTTIPTQDNIFWGD